jgi:hypothetical protein
MCFNGTDHIYIITSGMHGMIYVKFHARHIYMPMSLNGMTHIYIIMARLYTHASIFHWFVAANTADVNDDPMALYFEIL